jgi:hypothetical protein
VRDIQGSTSWSENKTAMLRRYLENVQFREQLIRKNHGDLGPGTTRLLPADGLPADCSILPEMSHILGIKGIDLQNSWSWAAFSQVKASKGSLDGKPIYFNVSQWDGFLCRPSAILSFFGDWTQGVMGITYDDRILAGSGNKLAGGVHK